MIVNIYTDGASRSNPGKSASGYRIMDEEHNLLAKGSFYNGIKTNNEAEYIAIIAALEKTAEQFGYETEINLYSDSELVVRQLNKVYKVKDSALKELSGRAGELIKKFGSCKLENVRRENRYISMVDKELNLLLDKLER